MRIRELIEQASTRGVPEWLVREVPSKDGGMIRDEWARKLADPKSDAGTRRLAAAMLKIRSARPTKPLLGRANARALRWVESATGRSRLAHQLRESAPSISIFQRIFLRLNSCAWGALAFVIVVFVKVGLFGAIDGVMRFAERVSRFHIDRHIGPMT